MLVRIFLERPVMANLLVVVLSVAGLLAVSNMPRENSPRVSMDEGLAIYFYPGVAPEEMEKLVTLPVEDQVKSLDDLDHYASSSEEGKTVVFLEYEPGMTELEFDRAFDEFKTEIDKAQNLPEDMDDPFTLKIASDEIWPVLGIALGGKYDLEGLEEIADDMAEEIREVEGVGSVNLRGTLEREIWVQARRDQMEAYGVSIEALVQSLKVASVNIPAGKVDMGREEFLVRTMGEVKTAEEISKLPILAGPDGRIATIGDVADVIDTFEDDRIIARLNGQSQLRMDIFMKREGSVIDVVDATREIADRYKSKLEDMEMRYMFDASEEVRSSLNVLSFSALQGMLMVALCIWFFMGFRTAIFALIGIPFAFLTTFWALDSIGHTINTLSLFAFILVLGMLVDDAIIVIENIYRHMEMGKNTYRSALEGTKEVMIPVISAVLTSIAAFLPLLMMTGVIGKFMSVLPVAVGCALAASLIEALVVLPVHMSDWGKAPDPSRQRMGDRVFEWLKKAYVRQINIALNWRISLVVGTLILTLVLIGVGFQTLRVKLFHTEDPDTLRIHLRMPVGTRQEETLSVVKQMEQHALTLPKTDIKNVSSVTGLIVENYQWSERTNVAMLDIDLFELEEGRRPLEIVKKDLRDGFDRIAGISTIEFKEEGHGAPPTGMPIELRVRGDDIVRLNEIATEISEELKKTPGIFDVRSDYEIGKREIRFLPHREKLAIYGTTMGQVAQTIRTAIDGTEATAFRETDGDEIKVIVKYRDEDRSSVNELKRLKVVTALGNKVALSELGTFEMGRSAAAIKRYNGKRSITVTANVNEEIINSHEANKMIKDRNRTFSMRFPGYSLDYGGEAEKTAESFGSLIEAFAVALLLIYMILGAQFGSYTQPLIIMFTVPFAVIGVIIGLIVTGLDFSLVAGISLVALAGVVVNDAIVLVEFIQNGRKQGLPRREAVVRAGVARVRPILLTTVTTIFGMLPLALGIGGVSPTWQPMAICMIWGLSFATFLTLFVIPCLYSLMDAFTERVRRLFKLPPKDWSEGGEPKEEPATTPTAS